MPSHFARKNRRRLLAGFAALVMAILLSIVASRKAVPKPGPMQPVAVAAKVIAKGTVISPGDVTTKEFPLALVPASAISSARQAVGQVARVDLVAGDPVLRTALSSTEKAGMAYRLPPGQRAFTVSVGPVSGVGGNLQPGDLVDVIAVTGSGPTETSRILLKSLKVLTLGGASAAQGPGLQGGQARSDYTTVTLAVTPSQAVALALAESVGTVDLSLRSALGQESAAPGAAEVAGSAVYSAAELGLS